MASKAIRLSPHDPDMANFVATMGWGHMLADRYDEAIRCAERAVQLKPQWLNVKFLLAACYGHAARPTEARSVIDDILRQLPRVSIEQLRRAGRTSDRLLDGLRKAGLPES